MNIAIYMEGGGQQAKGSKAAIRQGMDAFLSEIKEACRNRNWHWRLVCCGPRNEAHRRFREALSNDSAGIVVLLVDSETAVNSSPEKHLAAEDGWSFQDVDKDTVHLMVQTMETWIVADPDTLKKYYGRGFRKSALPSHENLEKASKESIAEGLNRATRNTQKGKYDKIRHARHLLERMDAMVVRQRCLHCKRLFETLLHLIDKPSQTP